MVLLKELYLYYIFLTKTLWNDFKLLNQIGTSDHRAIEIIILIIKDLKIVIYDPKIVNQSQIANK